MLLEGTDEMQEIVSQAQPLPNSLTTTPLPLYRSFDTQPDILQHGHERGMSGNDRDKDPGSPHNNS